VDLIIKKSVGDVIEIGRTDKHESWNQRNVIISDSGEDAYADATSGLDSPDQSCQNGGRRARRRQQGMRLHQERVPRGGDTFLTFLLVS
jgi:hypothetical protein